MTPQWTDPHKVLLECESIKAPPSGQLRRVLERERSRLQAHIKRIDKVLSRTNQESPAKE